MGGLALAAPGAAVEIPPLWLKEPDSLAFSFQEV
jgi:hypothetical protein